MVTVAGNPAQVGNNYEYYGYNGEYTHTNLDIQYLRARYYHMETGTFTSKDTYTGRLTDILSQNRYTYEENNPVTYILYEVVLKTWVETHGGDYEWEKKKLENCEIVDYTFDFPKE